MYTYTNIIYDIHEKKYIYIYIWYVYPCFIFCGVTSPTGDHESQVQNLLEAMQDVKGNNLNLGSWYHVAPSAGANTMGVSTLCFNR